MLSPIIITCPLIVEADNTTSLGSSFRFARNNDTKSSFLSQVSVEKIKNMKDKRHSFLSMTFVSWEIFSDLEVMSEFTVMVSGMFSLEEKCEREAATVSALIFPTLFFNRVYRLFLMCFDWNIIFIGSSSPTVCDYTGLEVSGKLLSISLGARIFPKFKDAQSE